VQDGALLVPFPEGQPLSPGAYQLALLWRDVELAIHQFSVSSGQPRIRQLNVSLTPGGQPLQTLRPADEIFYVNYEFQAGCQGAPYWISVLNPSDALLCGINGVLQSAEDRGELTCYRGEGQALEEGDYVAAVTLMGVVTRTLAFSVEAPMPTPTPTPEETPVPPPVSCGRPFTAAGLTSAGEPFLPLSLFDWYTQAVYVGSACVNLRPGVPWTTVWYRDGESIREARGSWDGAAAGVVWDSLTGSPDNPFLASGAYSVTLQIADIPLQATFAVYAYEPSGGE
jgi:hypothetical protein